jgi:hypothetical protein
MERKTYRSRLGNRELKTVFMCGGCHASWPCYAMQRKVIDNAIEKGKIQKDNLSEHQN